MRYKNSLSVKRKKQNNNTSLTLCYYCLENNYLETMGVYGGETRNLLMKNGKEFTENCCDSYSAIIRLEAFFYKCCCSI